ncbi:DUF481 domain-containing protein [Luteimonas viscosa]|uniref:DUF481 domain-containing protein n=1 Tax=Luteimonas viscosa TaxID=1132694 RepID=A0A5D4XQ00_9GAMM|nr:DUF481 domain-containing protein [Luteimonas viscosa]TYT26033.1 DUF481 domain-containing protein [Luteimonas viscosa]
MFASWWLAVVGLPVFMQPLPEAPALPAAIAVASGQVSLRQPCLRLACADAEWTASRVTRRTLVRAPVPGAIPAIEPQRLPRLATRRYIGLHSPASRRDWFYSTGGAALVDTRYGLEPVRSGQTQVQIEFGTGYRLQPYANYGTAAQGPVATGQLRLSQRVGERAEINQQVRVERGRENAFVRQTIGLDLQLDPQWSLLGDLEVRHDSAGNGGDGRTDREGSVRLRYAF